RDHYADPEQTSGPNARISPRDSADASEIELRRRDGKSIWVLLREREVRDADGTTIGRESTLVEITERKHLEEQLLQSQKMEAIGRLAGGVAHDFNNLLTAILGYSQLASLRLDRPEEVKHDIEEIEKAGRRASALTNQLLVFSRRQVIQPRVVDLNSIVKEAESILRRLIGEDIELVTSLAPAIAPVRADPTQIEQIIMNLAVNARDAMPEGGKLTIETDNVVLDRSYTSRLPEAAHGDYVMLTVADTGHGMNDEIQSHIFEPFFTTKEMGKGTGLGLSTVYGIVKQAGGHLDLWSAPGAGATFKIYLPPFAGSVETPSAKPSADSCRGSETVLLVEDDSAVRSLARLILESAGYSVIDASNADGALSLCSEIAEPIELLITDVVMPGSSGPKLAERMRLSNPDLKVLFISGYTDQAIPFGELTS
ncbi:MAG: ATP-binding protein, partial [Blastocatellia bacterium]